MDIENDKNLQIELIKNALDARNHSYCPYSNFSVGAALLCKDGSIYQGANQENAAFGPTICAERVAIPKAVFDGHRDFVAIAIVGGPKNCKISELQFCPPCGVCRQVMSEFVSNDFKIILTNGDNDVKVISFKEIMPYTFSLTNLK